MKDYYTLVPGLVGLVIILATQTNKAASAALSVIGQVPQERYAFSYAVNDQQTGDHKAQWEANAGGTTKGSYSLMEPDGSLRVVDYTADDADGFNATVKRLGPGFDRTHDKENNIIKSPVTYGVRSPYSTTSFNRIPTRTQIVYGLWLTKHGTGFDIIKLGNWSLPWDPITSSYGGWVPLKNHGPYVTIISRIHKDGKVKTVKTGPISLRDNKIILRKRP